MSVNPSANIPAAALEVAARALHGSTLLGFLQIQNGNTVGFRSWEDSTEASRQATIAKVRRALDSPTFDDYYAWLTLPERLAGPGYMARHGQPPAASDDTERTRGHRAEYYLVHHLLRIDDAALLSESGDSV
ncbi:hypothetical protein ACFWV1_25895 [Streptomyces sp. NPDC058700]|uniref:hypothetical protein n=1 Tax=Streptomyces sp. NPDC058700 TaxID=3346607 RepID=UPI0036576563